MSSSCSLFTKWCCHCAKLRKEEVKQNLREEAIRQKARYAEEQNAMFEAARQQLRAEELQRQATINRNRLLEQPAATLEALAQEQTAKFLASPENDGSMSQEDVLLLFKFINIPREQLTLLLY